MSETTGEWAEYYTMGTIFGDECIGRQVFKGRFFFSSTDFYQHMKKYKFIACRDKHKDLHRFHINIIYVKYIWDELKLIKKKVN